MKKPAFFTVLVLLALFSVSAKTEEQKKDTYDYDNLVTSVRGVCPPLLSNEYILFTAENTARTVGIAFDFENFNKIHAFSLRRTYDYEGEETNSWYFYVLKVPPKTRQISYKLIIDGLWTIDPTNPNTRYDSENGVEFSCIDIPQIQKNATEETQEGFTKFVCTSEPGKTIRLGGTFTNWDSWIYEMQETSPGKYELCLPLPPGTYYYAYYNGLTRFIDPTNPAKAYTPDGKTVSAITVE